MFSSDLSLLAVWPWVPGVLNVLVILTGLFLILLVLIQRGKGGGLAGAFGGIGGSSAFGSRAGDLFTRITIITAAVWILLIMLTVKVVQPPRNTKSSPTPAAIPPESGHWQPQEPSGPASDIIEDSVTKVAGTLRVPWQPQRHTECAVAAATAHGVCLLL